MILDIILAVLLVIALFKGYQQGLIIGVFSVLAFIIGLAAAIKLSAVVAGYIGKAVKVSDQWLPVISFVAVFLVVVLLIRMGANLIRKTFQFAMLGWVDKIGGILLFSGLYILIYSIVIFYAEQLSLIRPETRDASVTYSHIHPLGPKVIDGLGKILPFFKGMFQDLKDFFGNVSDQIPPAK